MFYIASTITGRVLPGGGGPWTCREDAEEILELNRRMFYGLTACEVIERDA